MNINKKLELILPTIKSQEFLANKGLGNEIGFYIFDYPPEHELVVREHIAFILKQVNYSGSPVNIIDLDLFNLTLEILEQNKIKLEQIFQYERDKGPEGLFKALKPVVKPEHFVQLIGKKVVVANIVFLTGVGKIWPMVRSHTILNNLHHVLDKVPVIMFFPGAFDGFGLQLFGRFKDDNYYRAFKLIG